MSRARPMTSFIGRERALRETRDLLGHARLVTVTGTGGVGKTRLATELMERAARAFPDGACLIELATIDDGSEVASVVVSALDVPDQSTRSATEQLVRHLASRRTLLVIDNCEHVLQEVADLLSIVLDAAPGLRVLATSREPLGLAGEQIYPLEPLSVPDGASDRAAVESTESVRLLLDRARSFDPHFAVTDDNVGAVAELCGRLDGMPLALELAAARLRSLSAQQVVERLSQRFQLLVGGTRGEVARHRTLWDLVDWSHELCTPSERLLWARLSVFPGTFDLEAAEQVCGYDDLAVADVVDVLDRLVAKSILSPEAGAASMRYRMLVTMREYGAHRLEERGERNELRRRHRDHYLQRAATMVTDWCRPQQPAALAAMRRDHANVLAAMEWSASTPGEQRRASELASLLRYHWIAGGFLSDGRRWLERILLLDAEPTRARGDALWVTAWVALIQGDREAARVHLEACAVLAQQLEDEQLRAHVQHWGGLLQLFSGKLEAAITGFSAAATTFARIGDEASLQTALFQQAMAQTYAGEASAALETCQRVLALSAHNGEEWCRAYSLWVTGVCQWRLGDRVAAREAARAALGLQRAFQDGICIALTLELLSWIACDDGSAEQAAELDGAATAVWSLLGTTIDAFGPHITEDSRRMRAEVDRRLDATAASRLRRLHRDVTRLEAAELALRGSASATERKPSRKGPLRTGPLTAREFEIAQLIAEGLSNRAIAERLVISTRTVDGHVEHILAKLDYRSRAQVATWVSSMTVGQA